MSDDYMVTVCSECLTAKPRTTQETKVTQTSTSPYDAAH